MFRSTVREDGRRPSSNHRNCVPATVLDYRGPVASEKVHQHADFLINCPAVAIWTGLLPFKMPPMQLMFLSTALPT